MSEGSLVVVLGALDSRIREKEPDAMIVGTLWCVGPQMVGVILPNHDLWFGPKREICPADDQV